jgi:hypothetical protein
MKQEIKKLTDKLKSIMNEYDNTDYLPIGDCNIHIQGCLLTHCYYDDSNKKMIFSSGDLYVDKHAEEIILTDDDTIMALKEIIYCYD